jgi:hypothetical protein
VFCVWWSAVVIVWKLILSAFLPSFLLCMLLQYWRSGVVMMIKKIRFFWIHSFFTFICFICSQEGDANNSPIYYEWRHKQLNDNNHGGIRYHNDAWSSSSKLSWLSWVQWVQYCIHSDMFCFGAHLFIICHRKIKNIVLFLPFKGEF